VDDLRTMLQTPHLVDVNQRVESGEHRDKTVLHLASYYGHSDIIKLLLSHPMIDVNLRCEGSLTPYLLACFSRRAEAAIELVKDPRVDLSPLDPNDTLVCEAARAGLVEVVKWILATGRERDITRKNKSYAMKVSAGNFSQAEIPQLLHRFRLDPGHTRHQLRMQLGLLDDLVAELQACLSLLRLGCIVPKSSCEKPTARFFAVARQLPAPLQLTLCHIVYDSAAGTVSEQAMSGACKQVRKSGAFTTPLQDRCLQVFNSAVAAWQLLLMVLVHGILYSVVTLIVTVVVVEFIALLMVVLHTDLAQLFKYVMDGASGFAAVMALFMAAVAPAVGLRVISKAK